MSNNGYYKNHANPRFKRGRVVKQVHFVDRKDAGSLLKMANYQREGANALAVLEIAATGENRKTQLGRVKNVCAVIGIPLTTGGDIFTLESIGMVPSAGAEKISLNGFAAKDPELIIGASAQRMSK